MGHVRFLAFYLITGILAGLAHVAVAPLSEAPLIGASGAISGVLGAYLILHPFARLVVLLVFIPLMLPAWLLLLFWFGFQFFASQADGTGPVAWWAHIGGFAAGALLVAFFRQSGVPLFAREPPRRISLMVPRSRRRKGPMTTPAPSAEPSGERGPWERGPWEQTQENPHQKD